MCITPIGRGRVVGGYPADRSELVLVLYSKKDYTEDEWKIVAFGGPCRYKMFLRKEVTFVEE